MSFIGQHCSVVILMGHMGWNERSKEKVISWLAQDVEQLVPPGQRALPVFSLQELQEKQASDATLSRVLFYVIRGRRPSHREQMKKTHKVLKALKQWEKLKMLDGVLYRAGKDLLTGRRKYQFVVPFSLVKDVMEGVHDEAGHQGQARTLYLERQQFFGIGMECDIREHVKCCKRCVISKTPQPEGRASWS